MSLLATLARANARHPWSHNEAFSLFVLRHAWAVRHRGGVSALDVGCGAGRLTRRLSRVFPDVVGIEPDPEAAGVARGHLATTPGGRVEQRTFGPEERARYDLITFVASLHHMPLEPSLRIASEALRPGGRIVVVGVAADDDRSLRETASLLLNPIVGFLRHPRRAVEPPVHMRAPLAQPTETFDEVAETFARVLPGARVRRRLFWRYTAVWRAPADTQGG